MRPIGTGAVTITVPTLAPTISAAVAAARPGDLILISPGVYHESVTVNVAGITMRGINRSTVILDEDVLHSNGIAVTAPGVTVANLTVRNSTGNGVLVTGMSDRSGAPVAAHNDAYSTLDPTKFPALQGFHIDHVTSYNNGLYGIYAFDAEYGLIENSFASGGADSGIYVGQCKPCHTVVRRNVAERNAVGYEGANAGPDLFIVSNRFVGNRVGATILSDYQEAFLPQTAATLAGNVVADNNQADTPEQADGGFGVGIGIAGGTENNIFANLVQHNTSAGLDITSSEDLGPKNNTVKNNLFTGNGVDISYTPTNIGPGSGNCLAHNQLMTTSPVHLAALLTCPNLAASIPSGSRPAVKPPTGIAFTEVVAPPELPSLPTPSSPPPAWFSANVPAVNATTIALPDADLLADQSAIRW